MSYQAPLRQAVLWVGRHPAWQAQGVAIVAGCSRDRALAYLRRLSGAAVVLELDDGRWTRGEQWQIWAERQPKSRPKESLSDEDDILPLMRVRRVLAATLRQRIERAQMSQQAVAQLAGITPKTVARALGAQRCVTLARYDALFAALEGQGA